LAIKTAYTWETAQKQTQVSVFLNPVYMVDYIQLFRIAT